MTAKRTVAVQMRVEPAVAHAIQRAADRNLQTASTWLMRAAIAKLRQGGYLPPAPAKCGAKDRMRHG